METLDFQKPLREVTLPAESARRPRYRPAGLPLSAAARAQRRIAMLPAYLRPRPASPQCSACKAHFLIGQRVDNLCALAAERGLLTTVFAGLVFVVALYMLWRSGAGFLHAL